MFQSHLGEEAGTPTFMNQVTDGIIRGLSTPPQALPTNGTQPLATPSNTAVPTSPASPLSYGTIQPLAVMATRGFTQPAPAPVGMSSGTKLAIGAAVIGGIILLMKARR